MNPKRLVLAIITAFVGVWITDFLIHGVWLASTYKETMTLWRSDAEMQARMGWLMLGQLLIAVTFVTIWAQGFAATACVRRACIFGLIMGLFSQATTVITYAVQPFPPILTIKWFAAGVVQGVLLGLIVFFVYKPKPSEIRSEPAAAPEVTGQPTSS